MCRNDWTKWSGGACACCCSNGGASEADPIRKLISYGPMPTLTSWVSGDWPETGAEHVNQFPLDARDGMQVAAARAGRGQREIHPLGIEARAQGERVELLLPGVERGLDSLLG